MVFKVIDGEGNGIVSKLAHRDGIASIERFPHKLHAPCADPTGCVVCTNGWRFCEVCLSVNEGLLHDCPGEALPDEVQIAISADEIVSLAEHERVTGK
jgi:hypothetical protein